MIHSLCHLSHPDAHARACTDSRLVHSALEVSKPEPCVYPEAQLHHAKATKYGVQLIGENRTDLFLRSLIIISSLSSSV